MDLVDSYVKAVAKALPEGQREDIVGELSEDIRSEMEDKQRELGRPLTEEEQEGLLRQRGNPLLLAARYRQDQRSVAFGRQIIGPVLFPFYIKVLCSTWVLRFWSWPSSLRHWRSAGRRSVLTTSFRPACCNSLFS